MDLATFEGLRRFPTTSWAIWNDEDDPHVDFFRGRLEDLHARAVIVGLNRSEAWPGDCAHRLLNFHTPGHQGDRRLRKHIQDRRLTLITGCFMTDVSDVIKTDSGAVKIDSRTATRELYEKIRSIDQQKTRYIICLGEKAFNVVRTGLGVRKVRDIEAMGIREFQTSVNLEDWRVFRVWHSCNWGHLRHKSEIELPQQLQAINELIAAD